MMQALFNPLTLSHDKNYYEILSSYRNQSAVALGEPLYPSSNKCLYVFSRELAEYVLMHPDMMHAPEGNYTPTREDMRKEAWFDSVSDWMLFSDKHQHTHLRQPLAKYFSAKNVLTFESKIKHLADKLSGKLVKQAACDLIIDFVHPFVVGSLGILLGTQIKDVAWLKRHTASIADALDFRSDNKNVIANNAVKELSVFAENKLYGEVQPEPYSIGEVLLDLEKQNVFSKTDAITTYIMLLFVAQETVVDAIGNSIFSLANHPEQIKKLRNGLVVDKKVVDELLRFDSSVQFATERIAAADVQVGDYQMHDGDPIIVVLGSANRDEKAYSNLDVLDLQRQDNVSPLMYGSGMHICLGQHLARIELKIAIETLYQKIPHWELDLSGVKNRDNIIFRGLTAAPIMNYPFGR